MKMSLHKCKDTCHHHNCCNYIPHTYRFQQPYMYDATSGFSTSHHPSHIFVYDLWQRKLKSDKEHCIKHYLIRYLTTGTKFLYFYDKKVIMLTLMGIGANKKGGVLNPAFFVSEWWLPLLPVVLIRTVSFFLPFARRAANTLRPLADAILSRKPCLFFSFC